MRGYDVVGSTAIIKFSRESKITKKKKEAMVFLKKHKPVKTILEKSGKFSGRLRTQKAKYIAGENTKEVLHKENDCSFRFNIDTCYFSPRLSSERKEIAGKVKKDENVLVMFSGVGVFPIIIARKKKAKRIVAVELGRECNKYAKENVKRNKVSVDLIQGDVRKKSKGLSKFDRIVMPRPNLKDSFLDVAFSRIKSDGTIHYYGFYPAENARKELKELIEKEAKKAKKKIRILKIKKAGDIGVRKFRYRVDIKVN